MKNITISVPDEVYRSARVHAAQVGTSVSKLVADYLWSVSDAEVEFAAASSRRDEIADRIAGFSAADRMTRDEAHDRAALR